MLKFSIAQHYRDEALLKSLINYFGIACAGNIYKNRETFELVFTNFTEIEDKIVPFFVKYPIVPPPPASLQGVRNKTLRFSGFL